MALTGITQTTMETKVDKKATSGVITALSIDWTGVTEEQVKALAEKQIKVLLQSRFRAQATAETDKKPIPKTYTVKVVELNTGRGGMSTDQMLESLKALGKADPKFQAQIEKALGLKA